MVMDTDIQRYQCSFDPFFNSVKIKNKLHYHTLWGLADQKQKQNFSDKFSLI